MIFKSMDTSVVCTSHFQTTIMVSNDVVIIAVIAPQSGFVGNKYFVQETMQFSIHNPLIIEIINFDCSECLSLILDFMYTHEMFKCSEEHVEHIKHLVKLLSVSGLDTCSDVAAASVAMVEKIRDDCSLTDDAIVPACQYRYDQSINNLCNEIYVK